MNEAYPLSFHRTSSPKIITNPQIIEIQAGGKLLPLEIRIEGKDLEYQWELDGPGNLEGDPQNPAIFYNPPDEISENSVGVIITVRIRDAKRQEIVESILVEIINPNQGKSIPPPRQIVLSIPENRLSEPTWLAYFNEGSGDFTVTFDVVNVPETGTIILVGGGILFLVFLKRHRMN